MKQVKILFVAKYKPKYHNKIAPYTYDQAEEIKKNGLHVEYFLINKKRTTDYIKEFKRFKVKIKEFGPDIIHAHYGLSGLFANLQRKIPVVTTYHGSDINNPNILFFSRMSMFMSKYNIFVSDRIKKKSNPKKKNSVIPCGVDIDLFKPIDKTLAREKLGFTKNGKIVLFAGIFSTKEKNPELAKKSVEIFENVKLLEFIGYNREQVGLLMNAVDVALMTSLNEGSPQFIKEAMACNCPVISTDVGDVKDIIANIEGCYITSFNPDDVSDKLKSALSFVETTSRTDGRLKVISLGLDSKTIAKRIINVYKSII